MNFKSGRIVKHMASSPVLIFTIVHCTEFGFKMWYIALIFAVLIGLHFQSDCDLLLRFLPFTDENSQGFYKGKIVWITGASSGIGAQLAKDYTAAGAQLVISARRADALDAVARECALVGSTPLVLPLDVMDHGAQEEAYNSIIEQFGRVDILVLNAGRSQRALALETSIEDTRNVMELNVLSPIDLSKIVAPSMVERGSGDIIVISSVTGKLPTTLQSTYSASKFALHGYYDSFRTEVSQHGVNVLLVCPGPVKSDILSHAIRPPSSTGKEVFKQDADVMPTERCTHLILKALYWRFDEVWISKQPILAITYLAEYTPGMVRFLFKKFIGPSRIRAFQGGESIMDLKVMLGHIFPGFKKSLA